MVEKLYMKNIEDNNVRILKKITDNEAEFLMEQTAVRQVELIINSIYNKDLLLFLNQIVRRRLYEQNIENE